MDKKIQAMEAPSLCWILTSYLKKSNHILLILRKKIRKNKKSISRDTYALIK
jgi:hypothetical protein